MIFADHPIYFPLYSLQMTLMSFFFSHDNPISLVNTVNAELNKLTEWIRANKLSPNLQKNKIYAL